MHENRCSQKTQKTHHKIANFDFRFFAVAQKPQKHHQKIANSEICKKGLFQKCQKSHEKSANFEASKKSGKIGKLDFEANGGGVRCMREVVRKSWGRPYKQSDPQLLELSQSREQRGESR